MCAVLICGRKQCILCLAIDVSACTVFRHCHCTSMGLLISLVLGVAFVGSVDEWLFHYMHMHPPSLATRPNFLLCWGVEGGRRLDLATIVNFTPRLNQ